MNPAPVIDMVESPSSGRLRATALGNPVSQAMHPEDRQHAIAALEKRVKELRRQDDDLSNAVIRALEDVIAHLDSDRPSGLDSSATD